jgi:cytochrome c
MGARYCYVIAVLVILAQSLLSGRIEAQPVDAALRGHGGPVRALAVLPSGTLASAGFDSAIIIWNVAHSGAARVLRFHDTTVNALASRADGCLVSAGEDARIAIWCDLAAGPTQVLSGHQGPISALVLSPDGRTLVSGSWDRTVRLWAADGSSRVISEHAAPVTSVALSRDASAALSASYDGRVSLTPLVDGAKPARSLKLAGPVNGIAQTRDGHYLFASADGTIREFDADLQPVREIVLPDGPLTTVAVSPDGLTLAVGGMRTPVTLLERATGQEKARILGPGLPLWALAFSADGRELYTGGADRAVRRFDVATGKASGGTIAPAGIPETADGKDPGATVFRACRACHGLTAADTHLAGPTLHGIMGRRIASLPGYDFSEPLKGMAIVWTPETIAKLFEVGPTIYTPGTKMPEQRITDPEARNALVAWLARVTAP